MKKTLCDLCEQEIALNRKQNDYDYVNVRVSATAPGCETGNVSSVNLEICLHCARTLSLVRPQRERQTVSDSDLFQTMTANVRNTLKAAVSINRQKGM